MIYYLTAAAATWRKQSPTMTERRFFILNETVPATDIGSFMCRVVASKTLPLIKFAPSPPMAPGDHPHNTNDIIPSILPTPSLSTNRKEVVQVIRERGISIALTSFFDLNFARSRDEKSMLESQLVKRYTLPNPEHYFQRLMQNEHYARDVRTLLDNSHFHRAYLVTGFMTTKGAVWKTDSGQKKTNGFEVTVPVSELAAVPVPGSLDFRFGPTVMTSTQQNREMRVADEEIFAVSYSVVKLAYSVSRSAGIITKAPKVGPAKRAKAHHLALGCDDDSDEEIDVDSDDDYHSETQKSTPTQVKDGVVIVEYDEGLSHDDGIVLHINSL